MGDQLDRGDDERAILALLYRLEQEAQAAGGAVHVLLGNHEIMNAQGDLRAPPAAPHVCTGTAAAAQRGRDGGVCRGQW